MSIKRTDIWAPLPQTSRGVAVHLSYDKRSDRIAYASNKSVFLRSVKNPDQSIQYTGHIHPTTVAKFSPSGYYVASGDANGNVKVWDCAGDDLVTKGDYHVISGRINDLSWDADSKRIIAVGDGRERYGHVFTADSGNTVGEIAGHTAVVNAVGIRPTRPYRAATVSDDHSLVFYNGPPFKFTSSNKDTHTNFVHDVQFSYDGEHIVTVGADRKIALYDGQTAEFKQFIGDGEHLGGIFAVSWSPDSKKFVTASADATVRLWSVEGELLKTWALLKALENQQIGVVFAGDYIISLSFSGDLNYWQESSDSPVRIVTGHQRSITALTVIEEKYVYSGSYDGKVVRWTLDSEAGASPETVSGQTHSNLVVALEGNSTSNPVWSTAWDDTIKSIVGKEFKTSISIGVQPKGLSIFGDVIALVTESSVSTFTDGKQAYTKKLDYSANSVAISEGYVAVGTSSAIHLYSTDLNELSATLPITAAASYLSFSPNGKYLAVGLVSGKIILFDVNGLKIQTSRWVFHSGKITFISWHPDGEYAVSGSLDTNIIIYSVKTPGKTIKTTGAHKDGVSSVRWLNSNKLISAGADATIKLWDVSFH